MSLEKDIKSFVESLGLKLYDTSVVNENDEVIFRVSVISENITDGKREGVTLDTCVALTHLISPLLDVTPPVSGNYRLEVGSAGIERKINSLEQFTLSIGENVALTLSGKEKVIGKLLKVDGQTLSLDVDGETKEVAFSTIKKAKTHFEW
jgi:ribosome maturation factor RimP